MGDVPALQQAQVQEIVGGLNMLNVFEEICMRKDGDQCRSHLVVSDRGGALVFQCSLKQGHDEPHKHILGGHPWIKVQWQDEIFEG